jgi:hypothetical protein
MKKKIQAGNEDCERYGNRMNKEIFKIQTEKTDNKMAVPMFIYVKTKFSALLDKNYRS